MDPQDRRALPGRGRPNRGRLPVRSRITAAQPRVAVRATPTSMETKPPIPLAVLGGIQTPDVDDVAHEASLEELGRLVKTLGYEAFGRHCLR